MAGRQKPIILCPLVIEQAALSRTGLAEVCDIQCCGPGRVQVEQWFAELERHGRVEAPVVLAGLAGGVGPQVQRGAAYVISRVMGQDDIQWTPTWPAGAAFVATASVASSAVPLVTLHDKQRFWQETGADLVDMESEAFARRVSALGLKWAIVRGVSDDAATALPPGIDQWVNTAGRTRLGRVAGSLACRPWMLRDLMALRAATNAALGAVAAALGGLLGELRESSIDPH